MSLTSETALTALSSVKHPDLHRSLTELNLVRDSQGRRRRQSLAHPRPYVPVDRRSKSDWFAK